LHNADGLALVNNDNDGAMNDVDSSLDVNELGLIQKGTVSELPKDIASILGSVIVPHEIVQPETVSDTAEPADIVNSVDCYRIDVDNRVERGCQQIRYLLTRLSLLRTVMIKEISCKFFSNKYSVRQKFVP